MYNEEEEYTEAEIKKAVQEKRAVIHWHHGQWENIGTLKIYNTPEMAEAKADLDTRGKCWSMAEEVWSELATDYKRAVRASAGSLRVS